MKMKKKLTENHFVHNKNHALDIYKSKKLLNLTKIIIKTKIVKPHCSVVRTNNKKQTNVLN